MRGIKEALEKAETLSKGSNPTMPKEVSSNTSVKESKMAHNSILWILLLQFLGIFIVSIAFYEYIKYNTNESLTSINYKLEQLGNKLDPLKDQLKEVENSLKAINQPPRQVPPASIEIMTPSSPTPKKLPQHSEQYHKVDRGETLYRISKRYGISVDQIRLLNNLKQDQAIQPGQRLLVAPTGH